MTLYRKSGLIVLTICATTYAGYSYFQIPQAVEPLPASAIVQPQILDQQTDAQGETKVAVRASGEAFKITPEAMQFAFQNAAIELAESSDLKRRRPPGLENIDSPEELRRCLNQAMNISGDPYQLRYLGDLAFGDLVAGLKNPKSSGYCLELLMLRGKKAIPAICDVVKNSRLVDGRSAAVRVLANANHTLAVPALIEIIESAKWDSEAPHDAIESLRLIGDPRAVEPLRRFASRFPEGQTHFPGKWHALDTIRVIEAQSYHLPRWPDELCDLHQLCLDADTIKGETFGPNEIALLVKHVGSDLPLVPEACLNALLLLNAHASLAEILQQVAPARRLEILAKLCTPEAVEELLQALHSPDRELRAAAMQALGTSRRRWPVDLLIELLNDETLFYSQTCELLHPDRDTCPDRHVALQPLWWSLYPHWYWKCCSCEASISDARREVPLLRCWWQTRTHRQDFLAGRVDAVERPPRAEVGVVGHDE